MRTPGLGGALVLVAAMLAGACSVPGIGATRSPSPVAATSTPTTSSGSPSPVPLTNPLGVLVSQNSANYTVSLVGVEGRVIASAQTVAPAAVRCANGAAGVVPIPVSTSNARAYFMDAQGVVYYLASNGDAGRATSVPIGAARRSSFAVSPDDQRIAVVVIDFTANGATTKLYVEDLNGGGNHREIFTDSGAFTLWATGWHGTNNLVVAKVPACLPQSGGPLCCGPQEFHVVDPVTAIRRSTVGGPGCVIAGPPSPAGAVCESGTQANVLTWTGTTSASFDIAGQTPAYLSQDGQLVAIVSTTDPTTTLFPSKATVSIVARSLMPAS